MSVNNLKAVRDKSNRKFLTSLPNQTQQTNSITSQLRRYLGMYDSKRHNAGFILLTICIQTPLQDNNTLAYRTASATSGFILLTRCI